MPENNPERKNKPERPEHLVVQTAFLGDLLLGIPLFKELKRQRPNDKLTVFCRKGFGDLISKLGIVDDAIEADKSSTSAWKEAVKRARSRKYEWLICPHESVRSRSFAFHLCAKHKIGYQQAFNWLVFNSRIRRPMELPEALRQLALLQPIFGGWSERLEAFASAQVETGGQGKDGSLIEVPEWADMRVAKLERLRESWHKGSVMEMSSRSRELATELKLLDAKLAFVAPGSVWKTKMWTGDGFTRIARELVSNGYRVVAIGSPDEKAICDELVFRAPGTVSIAGRTTLFESAELLAGARVLVCNDSGAMHMASAAGVPTVSIFGPTVLDFGYRPWQNRATVVQVTKGELDCRPCGTHGANACPIGTHDCMRRITPEKVLSAAKAFL